jgi:cell division protein FtsB
MFGLRRPRLRHVMALAAMWAMTGYFGYHAVHGRHGLETRTRLTERAQILDFELKSLERARTRLARDVALLTPDAPDADLVEEIARDVLGYVHPADRIVTRR